MRGGFEGREEGRERHVCGGQRGRRCDEVVGSCREVGGYVDVFRGDGDGGG